VKYLSILLLITLCSCKSEKKSSAPTPVSDSTTCPSSLSSSSNLPLDPGAQAAVAIHANGKATTWTWQLKGTINTGYNVDVYDVDLFDTNSSQITSLKGAGRKVICYFSAGSSENWRSDFSNFNTSDMGKNLSGWDGEKWLDIRSQNVLDIMEARLDLAVAKGCDGVEPDNMDGYTQDSCFNISANDQLAYNRAIANRARQRGLSVGLKNDPDQVSSLVSYFDFSVSEQCYQYNECASYSPFIAANKPVFNAEYDTTYRTNPERTSLCNSTNTLEIRTLVLALDLDDSFRYSCF